jgi:branched-chain amino acid transport system permease protein
MAQTLGYRPINLVQWAGWGTYVLFLLAAPLVFKSNLSLTLLSQIGTFAIAALSYNMLLGQSGMLSFGHAVYIGLGGFIAIHTMNLVGGHQLFWIPTSLIPFIGGLAGAFFGVLFGYVTTRRSGTTFAMITLGIGELVASASFTFPEFFGGEAGITTDRTMGPRLLGISYGPQIQVYYLIVVWLLLSTIGMYAFTRTPLGRIANAVRDNPERVEFVGYNTQRVRYLVVIIAGFFAGISGGLGAINFEIVSAENVGAGVSGLVLLFTFVGGAGSFIGPIIGAVLYAFSYVMLSSITNAFLLYLGLLFLVMVIFAPGGIASLVLMNLRLALYGQLRGLLKPYLVVLVGIIPAFLGVTSLIELLYAHQLNVGNGVAVNVWGFTLDNTSTAAWLGAAALTLVGAAIFMIVGRYFGRHWSAAQTRIAERMQKGPA